VDVTEPASPPAPRGRHAPPLEVRVARQRARLLSAAAALFARSGYAEASAEGISREAGMSKATFYEHFANKEECILALFDATAELVVQAVADASDAAGEDPGRRRRAGVRAFLQAIVDFPDEARTFLVEIIGAGPRAAERRAVALEGFADRVYTYNQAAADEFGTPRLASRDDAYAIVGAINELASRHLREGRPANPFDLAPVIERVHAGVLAAAR
jgi:AcrR family transcriptional regulator